MNTSVSDADKVHYLGRIGQVLRHCRQTFSLTEHELGKQIGASSLFVSRMEEGKIDDMPLSLLIRCAKAFGMTGSEFVQLIEHDDIIVCVEEE